MNEEEKQVPEASQAPQTSQASQEPEVPEEKKSGGPSPLGGRSVFAYLAVLFGAAFLLLLFAYLMQQRDNADISANLSDLRASVGSIQSIDQLTEENRALREKLEALNEENDSLKNSLQAAANDLADEKAARERAYTEFEAAYDKYTGYTSILETLYTAEIKLADKDYAGAADALTDIQYQYFVDTVELYDAEVSRNPDATLLRPRFNALVEELTERGALDGDWDVPAPVEDNG